MATKAIFPGLKTYLTKDNARSRYFVQGKGEIRLSKTDFKAQGGEGAIYLKGATAYKIYNDPARAIQPAKILELSVLANPNIVRPLDVVLNRRNEPVGYSMRAIGKSFSLCQLFPKAFRLRNNLTPQMTLRLVQKLQEGVRHIHEKGILVVDLNEMNFLVSEDFGEIYFIDVDSYQTPSFPAAALMETVRDRHANTFTTNTDWFSFAIVSFQMFVGIHPFKGTYPPLQILTNNETKLDARMRANISVLHKDVSVPGASLPFSMIPPAFLEWYRAVFEEGKRLPPPDNALAAPTVTFTTVRHALGSKYFTVTQLREFEDEIIWHDGVITITRSSVYFAGRKYSRPPLRAQVTVTPRLGHLVLGYLEGTRLRFTDLTANQDLVSSIEGEEMMLSEGQFYLKLQENIFAIELLELPQKTLLGLKPAANVMSKATRLFDGVALQNLLGAYYASIFPAPGVCHQIHLPELAGLQIVDARLHRNVLMVVGTRAGRYDKWIFRFANDFSSYDSRVAANVSSTAIEFTVLDSGVVLHMTDEDELEIFSCRKGSVDIKVIADKSIQGDVRLFHTGSQALIARGNTLYKIKMK